MRDLVTGLLSLLFIAAFFVFFFVGSLLQFAGDSDQVVEAARVADSRGALVDAVSELAAREVNQGGGRVAAAGLRPAIADVVTQAWFDATVRGAHGALVEALEEGATTAVFDLRPVASELGRAVDALARRADTQCERFLGDAACANREAASEVIALQRFRAHNAIARLPLRVDVVDLLGRASSGGQRLFEIERVRRRLGDLRALRWLGLAFVVGCLALIAFVNLGSGPRVLGACGSAVVAAAVVYLAVVYIARGPLGDRAIDELSAWRAQSDLDVPAQILATGADRFALASVEAATGGSTGTVALLGALGFGLGVIGFVTGRSER